MFSGLRSQKCIWNIDLVMKKISLSMYITTMDNFVPMEGIKTLQYAMCKFSHQLQTETLETVFLD